MALISCIVIIRINDTGLGIPKDILPQIFEQNTTQNQINDEKVDDATDYGHLVDSIPGKNPHKDGYEINGLSVSYCECELAVVKEIALTEDIYDSIRKTALEIKKF